MNQSNLFYAVTKLRTLLSYALCLFSASAISLSLDAQKQWQDDIKHYRQTLVNQHISPFNQISEHSFNQQLNNLNKQLAHLNRYQVIIELMKIHRQIGDGHTSIPLWEQAIDIFPVYLLFVQGEVRVVTTNQKHQALLGARLTKIGEHSVEDVIEQFKSIAPFVENDSSMAERVGGYMMVAQLLQAMGIIEQSTGANFTFVQTNNDFERTFTTNLTPIQRSKRHRQMTYSLLPRDKMTWAKSKSSTANTDKLKYQVNTNNNSLYIRFEQYPNRDIMSRFAKAVLKQINDKQIENLIIDLRDNYGGDLYTGVELARWLNLADSINWQQGVYVLVGRKTYSAAMVNAMQFRQLLNAKIVGELPGAVPTGFQDMDSFKLPNSGLLITYSKRRFNLSVNQHNQVPLHHEIKLDWPSIQQGVDQSLQWVDEDIANHHKK